MEDLAVGLWIGVISAFCLALALETSLGHLGQDGIILSGGSRNGLFQHSQIWISAAVAIRSLVVSIGSLVVTIGALLVLVVVVGVGGLRVLGRVGVAKVVFGGESVGEDSSISVSGRSVTALTGCTISISGALRPASSSISSMASTVAVSSSVTEDRASKYCKKLKFINYENTDNNF